METIFFKTEKCSTAYWLKLLLFFNPWGKKGFSLERSLIESLYFHSVGELGKNSSRPMLNLICLYESHQGFCKYRKESS